MAASGIAMSDAGTPGTEGPFTKEEVGFVPRNIDKLREIQKYLSGFRWEVVTNWCSVHQKVIEGAHDHGGRPCHPRAYLKFHGYPTIGGKQPSLDTLLVVLRHDGVAELDPPDRQRSNTGVYTPAGKPRRRRSEGLFPGGW